MIVKRAIRNKNIVAGGGACEVRIPTYYSARIPWCIDFTFMTIGIYWIVSNQNMSIGLFPCLSAGFHLLFPIQIYQALFLVYSGGAN